MVEGLSYFTHADHLCNVSAWTNSSGGFVSGSLARYEPCGGYRTTLLEGYIISVNNFTSVGFP